jgi:membrane-associated protease RseP (regulator of RpoE activity)
MNTGQVEGKKEMPAGAWAIPIAVGGRAHSPQLGEFFGVKDGNGVLVRSVEKGSRAEKAGFNAGAVIVKVNDQFVHDTSDFMHAVRSRNGAAVSVGVIRDKKENLNLSLPERKETGDMMEEESSRETPNRSRTTYRPSVGDHEDSSAANSAEPIYIL